jgi:hypothetical protein
MALLTSTRCYRRASGAALQEHINEATETKQVFERAGQLWILWTICWCLEIRPRSGNQRLTSIRQDQDEPKLALAIGMLQDL